MMVDLFAGKASPEEEEGVSAIRILLDRRSTVGDRLPPPNFPSLIRGSR